jgi:hypothetical protein
MVTMAAIVVNRLMGYCEIEKLFHVAEDNQLSAVAIQELNSSPNTRQPPTRR